jgi:histidine triad (HIT) family protein
MLTDCLFCKIVRKEIPSTPVYEDEDVYAFLDIKPVNPGHVLVVPKKHSDGFHDADPSVLQKLIVALQTIARSVKEGLGSEAFNIQQNNGEAAGQVVHHLHFHIVPRTSDDGLRHWPGKPYASPEEAAAVAQKIRKER